MKCWYKDVCNEVKGSCENSCIRYSEMKYLVDNSGIPLFKQTPAPLFAGEDHSAYRELANLKSNIVEFVKHGENVYITSKNTGNGKTSWAVKLLMKYFDSVWAGNGFRVRGIFVYVPQLLLQLKDFNNPLSGEYKQHLLNCDLVVWDDIGSTELSNYDLSQMMLYIDQRIMNGKSNVFTGNLNTKDKFSKVLGERLTSRIWNTSRIIEFVGKDRRNDGSVANSQ